MPFLQKGDTEQHHNPADHVQKPQRVFVCGERGQAQPKRVRQSEVVDAMGREFDRRGGGGGGKAISILPHQD